MSTLNMAAFGDEVVKIAMMKAVTNGFKRALKVGWQGTPTDKVGKWGKGLMIAGTGAELAGSIPRDDLSGHGRSKIERGLGAAGNAVGGLAGGGAGLLASENLGRRLKIRPGGRGQGALGMAMSAAAGIGGGILGTKFLTAPMAHSRQVYKEHAMRQTLGPLG